MTSSIERSPASILPRTYTAKFETLTSQPLTSLDADIIDITCGQLQARLHKERFICPGINRECIEFDGRFVTPKAFYVMGDKASLKDWKNAIRVNGQKIRRYIESGELDFYNHAELCTGRCKSRAPVKNSIVMDTAGPTLAGVGVKDSVYTPMKSEPQWAAMPPEMSADGGENGDDSIDIKPDVNQLNHMMLLNLQPGAAVMNSKAVAKAASLITQHALERSRVKRVSPVRFMTVQPLNPPESEEEQKDEDKLFWKAIVELGLIDEFFREIKSNLDILKNSMIRNYVPISDAKKASAIVHQLGLRTKLDYRLSAHKTEFDRQRDRLDREVEELKKRMLEYEQRKEQLKRKSDCFEQLINKNPRISNSDLKLETNKYVSLGHGDHLNSELFTDSPRPSPRPNSQGSSFESQSPPPSQESWVMIPGRVSPSQDSSIAQSQESLPTMSASQENLPLSQESLPEASQSSSEGSSSSSR